MASGFKQGFSKKKLVSIFRSTAFKITACIALFLTSLLIAMAMLLGEHAGTFVIRVQSGDVEKSIHITENDDYTLGHSKTLRPTGFDNMTDYSPEYFIEDGFAEVYELTSETGLHTHDNCLYIYTFYIVNTGSGAVGVDIEMNVKNPTNDLDDLVRVMSFYDYNGRVSANIYQKPDTLDNGGYPTYNVIAPRPFVSNTIAYQESVNINFMEGQNAVKYSVFFWLEGNDPDSLTNAKHYYGGTIEFELNIKVAM